jgi:uncharacterized protein (TIGR02145 family)
MKNTFAILTLFITTTIFAQWGWGSGQAPQGFNYQATVRNNSGQLLLNQMVLVKFTILQDSAKGAIVYSENQSVKTDDLGHINLVVGQGEATVGTFASIYWASGTYYMGIELNTGNGYVEMGTTQLLSVPYALYALNSANSEHSNSADYLNWQPQQSLCDLLNNSWNGYESACGHKIQDLSNPTNPQDAATKDYVDTQLQTQIANLQAQIVAMQAQITSLLPILTKTIGTQNWTTKNLDVAIYSDGTLIPEVQDPQQWASLTTGAWCYQDNTKANGTTYGKLYNWYAVAGIWNEASKTDTTQRKKLAPTGYHIPSDAEWTTLTTYLGGGSVAGGKMKEAGTTNWLSTNIEATNSSGFTGLPGGFRSSDGTFGSSDFIGYEGFWWSSSEASTTNAWNRNLIHISGYAYRYSKVKTYGFSVRCLRD